MLAESGKMRGRKERECGQTGVNKMQGTSGWTMDPPAASEYAVEPAAMISHGTRDTYQHSYKYSAKHMRHRERYMYCSDTDKHTPTYHTPIDEHFQRQTYVGGKR
jgi:hypothetical protein